MEEGGRGGSSGRLVSPPLLLPSVVPSSVPPAALAGVVPLAVPVPLPPPDPPPSALAAVELASDRPRATPTVALTLPTMQSIATTTNPPSNPTFERPRRSTANYNRSYALNGQGRKEGRDSRVMAESRSMDQLRRGNREIAEEADDGTDGEGSNESESDDCSDRESAGENVTVVLFVGFVVASLQCTIICWLVLIVAIRIPTLLSLYCAVVVMVMDYS